nr:glycosyltransferase family 4 protein [uncultured Methanoregula sp.]
MIGTDSYSFTNQNPIKMKIVIVIFQFPPKWLAGTEIATYNIAKHLAKVGHEIHIVTSHDEGLPYLHRENGFDIHRIAVTKIPFFGLLFFWIKICFEIKKIKPDIVHTQSFGSCLPAYVTKKILKIPYLVWGRGGDIYQPSWFIQKTIKIFCNNANAIVALTENMREKINEKCDKEIYVIPNGINLEYFYEIDSDTKALKKTKNIIFVGRLHSVKGVQYLITAMKQIHDEMPDVRLLLVGDGSERFFLENLTSIFGLSDCVDFIGKVPHEKIADYMNRSDIFVLPSISESFGMVNLEAMACGLPIVASRVGGIPDIVLDNVNGYLVEPKNSEAIAEKILLLLRNDQQRQEISETNRKKAKQYEWWTIIDKIEKIYLKILKDSGKFQKS